MVGGRRRRWQRIEDAPSSTDSEAVPTVALASTSESALGCMFEGGEGRRHFWLRRQLTAEEKARQESRSEELPYTKTNKVQ
jgi:hypothetical protein